MAFVSKRVKPEDIPAFMDLARRRYDFALQLDKDDRDLAEEDVRFAAALPVPGAGTTQWHDKAARQRMDAHRPCLTENRMPTFTAQVVNDGRQSKPAIKIAALDNGTKETAEYFQGRIRQIEYDCNADIAYDTSREQQVTSGRAFLRVTWGYVPGSFKKQARIEPIPNQFSVVFGPAREYDCSDAEYCYVISQITKEQHEREHGKDTTAARTDFAAPGNPAVGWLGCGPNGELIQKAEYWVKEYKLRTLCLLSNGEEKWQDELPEGLEKLGITVEEVRQEQDCTVVQYIIDGADILDETEIIGPYIGIVPVWGREWFVDGTRRTSSLIRYAKDPQRLLNLYVSNIAEQIAQMPKTPYMVPIGGIPAGSEAQWNNLNNSPLQYIYYNAFDTLGRPIPPPSRVVNEPPIAALVAGYNQAIDAIKAAMGIYDASLGDRSNETSGIAIDSRKRESDNANFHFHGNEGRSRKQIGRILLVLIPELDKGVGDRAVRSVDGKTTMVRVGEPFKDPKSGKMITHKLDTGNYGVAVESGPSFNSQREQAAETYGKVAQADKNFMSIAGDIFFRSLDAPYADEIADRYEKTLPPQLQPQKEGQDQIPPQVQQKFQQMQAQASMVIDQLTQELSQLQDDQKAQRTQMEFRLRMTEITEQTKRDIAIAELNQTEGLELLKQDLAAVKHRLEIDQAEADRQHQAIQAAADRSLQQEQQKQQQAQAQQAQEQQAAAPAEAAQQE